MTEIPTEFISFKGAKTVKRKFRGEFFHANSEIQKVNKIFKIASLFNPRFVWKGEYVPEILDMEFKDETTISKEKLRLLK